MSKQQNPLVFLPSHIDEGASTFEVEVKPEMVGLESYMFHTPIRCKLDFDRIGDRINLGVVVTAEIGVSCSKCGKPSRIELKTSSGMTFLPREEDEEEDVSATDLELYSEKLDIVPIVRDAFLLALPIAPLCRSDCKGLCPSCGADLNKGECSCDKKQRANPFEELKRLVDG